MKPKHSSVLDQIFKTLTAGAALLVLGLAGLILYQLIVQSWTSIKEFGLGFLTSDVWDPVFNEYGALPFIYGTVASSLIALLIAVPLSLGVAIFLSEIAPVRIRKIVGFFVEVLASIPSVIYGLWGVFVLIPLIRRVQPAVQSLLGFIPLFQGPPFGYSLIAAGMILAIMIIPTITSLSRDALNAVPNHQREASLALGATRWETIRRVVLPYNKSGIIAAVMLGLGRALGETMAVTMVIGNHPQINLSLFMPAQTMASLIANEFSEATDAIHLSALVEIGLILFLVTFTLNIIARLVIKPIKTKGVSR